MTRSESPVSGGTFWATVFDTGLKESPKPNAPSLTSLNLHLPDEANNWRLSLGDLRLPSPTKPHSQNLAERIESFLLDLEGAGAIYERSFKAVSI